MHICMENVRVTGGQSKSQYITLETVRKSVPPSRGADFFLRVAWTITMCFLPLLNRFKCHFVYGKRV